MERLLDLEVYRAVLDSLPDGVYLVDRQRRILLWNTAAEKITGFLRQEVIGRACSHELLMHCDGNSTVLCGAACPLAETMRDGRAREVHVFLRHKDGQRVPVRVQAAVIRDAGGAISGAVESFTEEVVEPDLADHRNSRAVHDNIDPLTGLPDRESMESHVAASLKDYEEECSPFGVLAIEIDKLDELRSFHGRKAVEAIERVAAGTLSRSLHPGDVLGCLGEGRFLVILADCPAGAVARIAGKLRQVTSGAAAPWWGERVAFTISIGATAVRVDDTAEALLSRSEDALRASQAAGGDQVVAI